MFVTGLHVLLFVPAYCSGRSSYTTDTLPSLILRNLFSHLITASMPRDIRVAKLLLVKALPSSYRTSEEVIQRLGHAALSPRIYAGDVFGLGAALAALLFDLLPVSGKGAKAP